MAFALIPFVLNRVVAQRAGLADRNEINRIALTGTLIGGGMLGVLLTRELAKRAVPARPVLAAGGTGATTGGTAGGATGGTGGTTGGAGGTGGPGTTGSGTASTAAGKTGP
jgi:hypothetical protein